MSERRSETALRAIRRVLRAAEMGSRRLVSTTGLTPSQLIVLQEIARRGTATPGAVAKAVRFSQATVTNLVDKLERAGLVERERGTSDRRQIWINVTDAGRSLANSAPDVLQDRFVARFEALADWEQAMILAMLERLGTLLDADQIEAAPVLDGGAIDRSVTNDRAFTKLGDR